MAIAGLCGSSVFVMAAPFSPALSSVQVDANANDVVHKCAGLNQCKGLGGCKVTKEKLAKLAKKKGVAVEKAGDAHACAGLNECKGLGGCKVTKGKLKQLKKKKAMK